MAAERHVSVNARLDGAPVVSGGDQDRVDAVHDALVVGRAAIRVEIGEERGFLDGATELGRDVRDLAGRFDELGVDQVGKNAQADALAGQLLEGILERFTDLVDEIGAHGVAWVAKEMKDGHRSAVGAVDRADLQLADAAAARNEVRDGLVGESQEMGAIGPDGLGERMRVGHGRELNLADDQVAERPRLEPAIAPHPLR